MYSMVDSSAKKRKLQEQEYGNDADTECQDFLEMYAVVDKNDKKSILNDGSLQKYAIVDKLQRIQVNISNIVLMNML